MTMGLSLGSTIANWFSYHFIKSNGFNSAQRNLKQLFTDDIFITFLFFLNWQNNSQNFSIILAITIPTCLFPLNQKKKKRKGVISKDRSVSRKRKFVTTVYRKCTLNGVCIHFESFLLTVYKFGMVCTLAYHCLRTQFFETSFFKKQVLLVIY